MGWSGRAPAPPAREAGKGTEDEEHAMSAKFNSEITVIGIDIGKNSFHIVGLDRRGAIVLRQKWSRGQVETRLANLPPCLIGMEACVGAHHLSRKLTSLGHDARLMPAKYVRPYSRGQKNDFRDTEAIAEASSRTVRAIGTFLSRDCAGAPADPDQSRICTVNPDPIVSVDRTHGYLASGGGRAPQGGDAHT